MADKEKILCPLCGEEINDGTKLFYSWKDPIDLHKVKGSWDTLCQASGKSVCELTWLNINPGDNAEGSVYWDIQGHSPYSPRKARWSDCWEYLATAIALTKGLRSIS